MLKQVLTYRRNETNTPNTDPDETACEALYINAVNVDTTNKTQHTDSDVEAPITTTCDCQEGFILWCLIGYNVSDL